MAFINFTSENKVAVPSIDSDHVEIASKVEKIYQAVIASDYPSVKNELANLLEILKIHFTNEETLMKENAFPGFYTHKLEHDRFYSQLSAMADESFNGSGSFGTEQLERIKQWFFNHIEINDRKCGNFLTEKGINN